MISLCILIRLKSSKKLGVSISAIDANSIIRNVNQNYKFYFEPKANSTIEVNNDWASESIRYTINNDTLNERFNYDIRKNKNVFRIIILGDSFTFGVNIDTEQNWTELLEDRLNKEIECSNIKKYEVINLGVGGYDTTYEVERYKMRGTKYKPDLIVWYITDFYRITEEIFKRYAKLKITEDDEKEFQKKGIYNYGRWEIAYNEVLDIYKTKENKEYQIAQYKKLRELYASSNPIVFLYSHDLSPIEVDVPSILKKELEGQNNYYLHLDPYDKESEELPDGHLNNKGHFVLMDKVYKYLMINKLIPC